MADALIHRAKPLSPSDGYLDPQPESEIGSSVLQRRIEFHPARKPFNGLKHDGGDFVLETLNPGSSSSDSRRPGSCTQGQSVMGAKKTDGSEFPENGLDPELSFGITVRRILDRENGLENFQGAGLRNMGNTCYLNSVLQCLTYTEPLAAYLQSGKHRNSCHIAGFCALCAIQKHVSLALQSTGRILAPKDLVFNLRCISRNFTKSRQEDAHEYMVNLLESMHKCCLPSGVPSESSSAYEKSLVHKIFGGRLRSQVKCLQCFYCSNKFDPFLDLSLEIAKANSLHKALVNFTAAEQLDGGEKQYQCQKCNQKVRALKQMTVHKPPYVLTIHLKRFRAHDPGQKIDKDVQFGPTLDLRPFVSGSYEGDLKYTLYGVLVHCGASTYSGHYYCYVRTSTGVWYSLDDNRVFQVGERTVLSQKAYMLFYVRDRRNIIPRKPVEVAQKENFKSNNAENKTRSSNNQGSKEPVQNVSVKGRSSDLASSVVAQKDVSTIVLPRVPLLKEASVNQNNGRIMTENMLPKNLKEASVNQDNRQITKENMVPKNEPVSESFSKASLSKDLMKGLSVSNPILGKDMLPSAPFSSCNGGTSDPQNATAATTVAKIEDCNGKGNSKENDSVSMIISPNVKGPQSFEAAKPVRDVTTQNNNLISSVGGLSITSSGVPSGITLDQMHTVKSSDQPSSKMSQVRSFTNGSAAGNYLGEKTSDCGQTVVVDESVKLSGSSIVTNGSLHVEAPDCKRHRKLKKKQIKCKVAGMRLRSSLFSGAVLSVRKKKKQKRSKHLLTSDCKSLTKEHLMDSHCFSSDLGPSTSEETRTISLVSACSKRKRIKSDLKKDSNGTAKKGLMKSHGDFLMDAKDGELRESVGQNGTVLASDKRVQNGLGSISGSVANQREAGGTDSPHDCKRDKIKNGWMGVLTRGPEETVVARWDGIEFPSSHVAESSHAESISIGYVADDWDEEYDRGKRKKVRQSKHTYGGPNPFQIIATEKSKLKKERLERFDSGDHPLRI